MKDAVLIAGPTASGKSALALAIAARVGGVVINADSMQVYRDLRIITARPTPQDEAAATHLLYGHVDAAENYSVGRWCVDVASAIAQLGADGRTAIVVGGTGLYFKALTQGLSAIPPIPAAVRAPFRARLAQGDIAGLYAELSRRDPQAAARIMPGDGSRITRALEVLEATSRPIGAWHGEGLLPILKGGSPLKVFLTPERAALYERIDTRFDAMLEQGALEEVARLDARGLDPALPAMKAHGVPWLRRYLHGEISRDEAVEGGKRDTRRYTKRQATWFRNQLPDWNWVTPEAAIGHIMTARRG